MAYLINANASSLTIMLLGQTFANRWGNREIIYAPNIGLISMTKVD